MKSFESNTNKAVEETKLLHCFNISSFYKYMQKLLLLFLIIYFLFNSCLNLFFQQYTQLVLIFCFKNFLKMVKV